LFIALIESSFTNNLGFDVKATDTKMRKDGYWFGEAQSRVVVSVKPSQVEAFKKAMENQPFEELGVVSDGSIKVDGQNWGNVSTWKHQYNTAIEKLLGVNANN
jgi:phosphoribosylformylglycinamidine synthase